MVLRFRVTYDPGTGDLVEWDKDLDELLMPNGHDTLLDWMLKEADSRGTFIRLESYDPGGPTAAAG